MEPEEFVYTGSSVFEAAVVELAEATEAPDVIPDIVQDLQFRDQQGEERYGVPLSPHNGRDALIDLYEELLDAYVYATQYDMERDTYSPFLSHITDALIQVARTIKGRSGTGGFLRGRAPQPAPEVK